MTTYEIVCKTLTSDQSRIERVGLIESGGSANTASSSATPAQINESISKGHKYFFTNDAGMRVEVDRFENDFIRTKPDGILRGNLRHLRNCRPFS
ncbi:MAG TPA: DUF3892 domain-containing protein [Candidatus Nitrosotalea sp.]|nr:DUF3892 domain-containing protein [Candidatus Nitrosotalea sp.]